MDFIVTCSTRYLKKDFNKLVVEVTVWIVMVTRVAGGCPDRC